MLYCAASHELMMNAGVRWREGRLQQGGSNRRDRPGNKDGRRRWDGDFWLGLFRGQISHSEVYWCSLWTGLIYLIGGGLFKNAMICECAANHPVIKYPMADSGPLMGVSGADWSDLGQETIGTYTTEVGLSHRSFSFSFFPLSLEGPHISLVPLKISSCSPGILFFNLLIKSI